MLRQVFRALYAKGTTAPSNPKVEHNFGHGNKNLSVNMALIMLLVFMIDQIQQASCTVFQTALNRQPGKIYLWRTMITYFSIVVFNDWLSFFMAIIDKKEAKIDTS